MPAAKVNPDVLAAIEAVDREAPPSPDRVLTDGRLGERIDTEELGDSVAMTRVLADPEWEETVTIYRTINGAPVQVLTGMLNKTLRKRHGKNDSTVPPHLRGKPVFSRQPIVEYVQNNNLCRLHPNHPDREWLNSIGLQDRFCGKDNLASEFDQYMHFTRKHPQAATVVKAAEEKRREKREDVLVQQNAEILSALVELVRNK